MIEDFEYETGVIEGLKKVEKVRVQISDYNKSGGRCKGILYGKRLPEAGKVYYG